MKAFFILFVLMILSSVAIAQDTTRVRRTYDSTSIKHESPKPPVQPQAPQQTMQPQEAAPVAQGPDYKGGMILGLRFLPTFTSLEFNSLPGGAVQTTFVMGYGFGGLIGYNFNKNVGLQAELLYSSLAQKYREHDIDRIVRLNYINIPILFSINTDFSKPVNLNIVFGPQIGINTGSSVSAGGNGEADTVQAVLAVKPGDLGLAYGAGLDFSLNSTGTVKLSLGYRGVIGLIDISDHSRNITTNQYYILSRSHVRTYAGYLGLTFAL